MDPVDPVNLPTPSAVNPPVPVNTSAVSPYPAFGGNPSVDVEPAVAVDLAIDN